MMISATLSLLTAAACTAPSGPSSVSVGEPKPVVPALQTVPRPTVQPKPHKDAGRVLVVINTKSPDSIEIGEYYVRMRGIPAANVVRLDCQPFPEVPTAEFDTKIVPPVRAALKKNPKIDFIVTTKGVPLRLAEQPKASVDARLGVMDLNLPLIVEPTREAFVKNVSPYFNKREPFRSATYKFWIVTRLAAYTVDEAKGLVDRAIAAKPAKGPFLLDGDPTKDDEKFSRLPSAMRQAQTELSGKGFKVTLDETRSYVAAAEPLMGWVTWGSNDASFSQSVYDSQKWLPGAIVETFVSTSGRRFHEAPRDGQSLIADLIRAGVTAVKGYVSEPYTVSLARPDVLLERYTAGFTMAESFAMASPLIGNKCVIIGDPLLAPYAK